MNRSYLFAPGHNPKLLTKVFDAGADAVILDLEDAVPPEAKHLARAMVAEALPDHPAWVRINGARTTLAAADLAAVAETAHGIRIPKVETLADVRWVAERAPGKPLLCAIESARGVLNAHAIASEPGVTHLALGGIDLQRELGVASGGAPLNYARSHLVLACRASGIAPPIDSVYPNLHDHAGLRAQTESSRRLGLYGKSAIHPTQLATIHAAFQPDHTELQWAHHVVDAFETAGGNATRLPSGEFIDLPVAERARNILDRAAVATS